VTAPSRYTCEQVFARLDDFLDRELSAAEMRLVQEHLDTCATCAREHRFEAALIRDVRQKVTRIDVPPGLLVRISERLRAAAGSVDVDPKQETG
jgi:mycothiol system anti-sigma-R factor